MHLSLERDIAKAEIIDYSMIAWFIIADFQSYPNFIECFHAIRQYPRQNIIFWLPSSNYHSPTGELQGLSFVAKTLN